MAPIASSDPAVAEPEKKKKRKEKSEKKRAREEDDVVDGHRKHKKSKSVADEPALEVKPEEAVSKKKEKRKKKKDKSRHAENDVEAPALEEAETSAEPVKKEKKKKKKHTETATEAAPINDIAQEEAPKEKKKKKKSRKSEQLPEVEAKVESTDKIKLTPATDPEAMDVDVKPAKSSKIYQPKDIPANPQFPFFTQTVSLYEPIYPSGWAEPITSSQAQILRPLQNRYVPSLHGVLLDYRNVALGEQPGRKGAATYDESPTTVASRNEYAVGFGWITADVDMFVPSRGAWMEGSVNLQTEGHIGVVCFGKFNASIEASRLLPTWRWVSNDAPDAQGFEETRSVITADEHGVVRQIHSTGFWVDEDGERVTGKIRFRIRNFDVGTSGPTSYLSLEGTMLDKVAERELVKKEAENARARKGISRRGSRRRVPDFAMTRFEPEEEQPQEGIEEPQPEVVKSSRPESEI
jgi:DNA-directed RNA polymerase I subunit RPA43